MKKKKGETPFLIMYNYIKTNINKNSRMHRRVGKKVVRYNAARAAAIAQVARQKTIIFTKDSFIVTREFFKSIGKNEELQGIVVSLSLLQLGKSMFDYFSTPTSELHVITDAENEELDNIGRIVVKEIDVCGEKGKYMIVEGKDGNVRIWDIGKEKLVSGEDKYKDYEFLVQLDSIKVMPVSIILVQIQF